MEELEPISISIIIPTRNGLRYLKYAIESVLDQEERNFELVVSDNHSEDGTSEYLTTITDGRFRVIRPHHLLAMVEHFEFALSSARGEWVTMLGDDDGIMPFFFKNLARVGLSNVQADAIVFRRAYYFWEGVEELHGDQVVINYPHPKCLYRNNRISTFLCLTSVIDYMYLPQTYTTGLVRRSLIEKIKTKADGIFFHGRAPDAASAVAILLHAGRHYRIEEPIFWTGTSSKSTGFSQASLVNKKRSEEFDLLNKEVRVASNSDVPQPLYSEFDFAVVFFDALLSNPCTGGVWRSAAMRHFFFAGLVMKDERYVAVIRESYGPSFKSWIMPPLVAIIRVLKKFHGRTADKLYVADRTLNLHSFNRALFPTMQEASAGVLERWSRLHKENI